MGQVRRKCGPYACLQPCGIKKNMVRRVRFLSAVENYISKPKPKQRTVTGFELNKDKQENQKNNEINYKGEDGKKSDVLFIFLCIFYCVLFWFPQDKQISDDGSV